MHDVRWTAIRRGRIQSCAWHACSLLSSLPERPPRTKRVRKPVSASSRVSVSPARSDQHDHAPCVVVVWATAGRLVSSWWRVGILASCNIFIRSFAQRSRPVTRSATPAHGSRAPAQRDRERAPASVDRASSGRPCVTYFRLLNNRGASVWSSGCRAACRYGGVYSYSVVSVRDGVKPTSLITRKDGRTLISRGVQRRNLPPQSVQSQSRGIPGGLSFSSASVA